MHLGIIPNMLISLADTETNGMRLAKAFNPDGRLRCRAQVGNASGYRPTSIPDAQTHKGMTMSLKNVEFKIDIQDFDADASKRLKAARDEVAKIEAEITKAYLASDRFRSIRDLSGYGDYGTKYSPITRIENYRVVTSVNVDLVDDKPTAATRPTLYLGEKTVNALLSGKLLTDIQKKSLLKQIGFDADADVPADA